jgi:hypothetical protein
MSGFIPRPRTPLEEMRAKAHALVAALYTCSHDRQSDWRRYVYANGQIELRVQCLFCGLTLDYLPPSEVNAHDVAAYAPFDESLAHTYNLFRREAYQAVLRRLDEQERNEYRWWYRHIYLHEDWWKRRRAEAIRAAGGKCERCHDRPATQVHHILYARLYAELPSDLQALCSLCHAEIEHPRKERIVEAPSSPKQLPLFN